MSWEACFFLSGDKEGMDLEKRNWGRGGWGNCSLDAIYKLRIIKEKESNLTSNKTINN